MTRQQIIQVIVDYLKSQEVKEIGVFGSFARNQDRPDSDIDILVEYGSQTSLFDVVRIKQHLASLVGRQVDLVSRSAIRPAIMNHIQKDLQIVYHE